jgi:hypothetical protein
MVDMPATLRRHADPVVSIGAIYEVYEYVANR